MRVNSGMSQRDLLDSGIDILDTNAEVYAEGKPFASQHNVDAQLYAAGLTTASICAFVAQSAWTNACLAKWRSSLLCVVSVCINGLH